ncbi:MAG TPA: sigma-70 family RNA polymerase sigma factor [Kofleriaceae bacterium]
MTGPSDAIVRELEGLRALARALVAGSADAEDLVQDTAVDALGHPPELDRPVRPWLATVLRNRRKMDRRSEARRRQRELAAASATDVAADAPEALDRARVLERLSAALVALDEPFRTAIVRRYLDGESAAAIARALDVPAGTVRWRIMTGLERLRAALDDGAPRWRRALVPFLPLVKGAAAVKLKTQIVVWIVLLLCLGGGGAWLAWHHHAAAPPATAAATGSARPIVKPQLPAGSAQQPVADPLPGQGRAIAADDPAPGGVVRGRVINWSTGAGVAGADLGFATDSGMVTVHSQADGAFELAPPAPTSLTLATIAAAGFLPYAPEYEHSSIHVVLAQGRSVSGLTVFLFPAIDYRGVVVDATNQPVAGAKVRLLGTPQGEQQIDKLATEWTSGADGAFTFHAADDAVFEATKGAQRGWARLTGDVAITHVMKIQIGTAPAREETISGRVVDDGDHPIADVLVRGLPVEPDPKASPRATAFATTAADGTFVLDHLAKDTYELFAEADGRANVRQRAEGGAQNVVVKMTSGVTLTGTVVTKADEPVPAFTLTVQRRQGAQRGFELAKSVVDAKGHFEIHVEPGAIEVTAAATGWAPSDPLAVDAKPGAAPLKIVVSTGATLSGTVVDAATKQGVPYARVMREGGASGGASASPANAGTVTRADGTFELTGLPPGPVSITIDAGDYHPKIQAGMLAEDGGTIGPITIPITKLAPGEQPTLELVGIGVALSAVENGLTVTKVIPGGGAEAAGIVAGDLIVAVDGLSAVELGVNGAVAKIRGQAGTTVAITVKRGTQLVPLVCERRPLKA